MIKKKYFIVEEDEQKGPFSFNELKEMEISKTTLIWKEGFEDWTEAGKIEKLQSLLKITPPKLPKSEGKKKKKDETLNVNLGLGKPKTIFQLREKELAKEKLKVSVAKNTTFYFKRILISFLILLIFISIYIYIDETVPKYIGNGVKSDKYEEIIGYFGPLFFSSLIFCFFYIFGRPLSQIFAWFKKYSEKDLK
jgi:hypothetical protein